MKKTINIGGVECLFKTSAAVPRMYRFKFNQDIFNDIRAIDKQIKEQDKKKQAIVNELKREAEAKGEAFDEEAVAESISEEVSYLPVSTLTTFENVAYIMHKHGDPTQPNDMDQWLEQFETFDIYQIFPEILEMWGIDNEQLTESKNQEEK